LSQRIKKKEKVRIDKLLTDRGLVRSRQKAQALIMARKVLVGGVVVDKAGTEVERDSLISLKEEFPYVSRGGIKLQGALDNFNINVEGLTAIDVGASTGGFTDCLLTRGVKGVIAIDVGRGLLDQRIREDERVRVLEGRNIRYLDPAEVGEKVDMVVIDVSFISLTKVLPRVKEFLKKKGKVLALIKPQFEVGKGEVGKGGVVKDPEKQRRVIESLKAFSQKLGLRPVGVFESPIKGAKGNREFWLYLYL
jgi:23S rRNA (cytidine1920-2'-O)/16S rRNA (cytidine1409-2'-O)-methyltransferase